MTRCPPCSQREGRDVDHTPGLNLPPVFVPYECFLSTKGILGRPTGAPDLTLPTRAGAVPSDPMGERHRLVLVRTFASVLTELSYLEHNGVARWTLVQGRDPRDLSARQVQDYMEGRFPGDRCTKHRPGECKRCCGPHHVSARNWVCEAMRKWGEYLTFEARQRDKPIWTPAKLAEIYGVTRRRKLRDRPPEINPVEQALGLREWLLAEARPVIAGQRDLPQNLYDRALALFKESGNAAAVARELGLPHATVYFWTSGRSRAPRDARLLEEMPRALGWQLYFLQDFGGRFEDLTHAEFPLEGPFVRFDPRGGTLTIIGKGKLGGKARTVTLTADQQKRLGDLLAWRVAVGKRLASWTGREPEPVLFPTIHDTAARSGFRLPGNPGSWNRTLRTWAGRYNEWLRDQGREGEQLDVDLVSSHRIGRAVSITRLAKEGVGEALIMEQRGIADHATLERYVRPTQDETREILEEAEQSRLARKAGNGSGGVKGAEADGANAAVLEELRALRKTVEDLRAEVREKDRKIEEERTRNRELMDRLLASRR